MDKIKESFGKVKTDISYLKSEIDFLKKKIEEISEKLERININSIKETPTDNPQNSTTPTDTSTHHYPFKPLKPQNLGISTGNQGVPTDRQTDRQTDRHTPFLEKSVDNAFEILSSLDNLKKEIRLKFKNLTEKEFLIFSTLYQLEEQRGDTSYKEISNKLNLTESSIRDYIGRLIKKGIPIEKNKMNNKLVYLSISDKLKKIATLPTILKLRDL
jgi:DNA-binding MarR family transcriptional regulator